MTLLHHLEQITISAKSIGEQEFAPSGPFTNALLHNNEITALIRDVEPHERGLFFIDPMVDQNGSKATRNVYGNESTNRRTTMQSGIMTNSSTVARVLGSEMLRKIQSSTQEGTRGCRVDIEVLLQGAEKLCAVYNVPGTMDRINTIRTKHDQLSASIGHVQEKLTRQQSSGSRFDTTNSQIDAEAHDAEHIYPVPETHLETEQEALQALEFRKRALEERIAAMDKDLGGLRK